MKAFNRLFCVVLAVLIAVFVAANFILLNTDESDGRPYRVEISRLIREIESGRSPSVSDCEYVTSITEYCEDFYNSSDDYIISEINGKLYRFDYRTTAKSDDSRIILKVNIMLGIMALFIILVMIYIRFKILKPFDKLSDVPYELSKGNLTPPIKENRNRYFGRFLWGVDMLRENIEQQKERELNLQKDKKMLLLSLSHDIKTPISAIKLYSRALSKELYSDKEKQKEIALSINDKADEIEGYVSQIVTASREDFLTFDIHNSEFYLSQLISKIEAYYRDKLALVKTELIIDKYRDMMLNGDIDKSIEVLQNLIENSIKYGDGKLIRISFSTEEECLLISVSNNGCTLSEDDLIHIFDSFWRGENSKNAKGSGLGLYICKQLMLKMNGEIFASLSGDTISVTAVFQKA